MVGKRADGIAVVTGAAGGMGSASARQLAEAGWEELLLCDISAQRLEAVAAPLRDAGAQVHVLAADLADAGFPAALIAALGGKAIGALIHTAGISPHMADAKRVLEVNLDATVRLVDAVRDHMAPGSAAVLFSSNSASMPMPPEAAAAFTAPLPALPSVDLLHFATRPELAYPLSKMAVRAIVRREAKSFGQRGARLVSLSPGVIDTPMTRGELKISEFARRMVEDSPLARMGHADELAAVAVFLCSPAASFVTAVDWLVDGGHTSALAI